jgi:Domain of unknown function (DUF397)
MSRPGSHPSTAPITITIEGDNAMQQLTWVKATASFANGNCVEVATLPDGMIGIRDSKNPDGPVLRFTPGEWDAFMAGALAGEFDQAARM